MDDWLVGARAPQPKSRGKIPVAGIWNETVEQVRVVIDTYAVEARDESGLVSSSAKW